MLRREYRADRLGDSVQLLSLRRREMGGAHETVPSVVCADGYV
jgi:hypothetical protein